MPRGLSMSKKRKSIKDANAYLMSHAGDIMRGIHTPTISSMTTRLGSSPQKGISLLVAHVPMIVKIIEADKVSAISILEDTKSPAAYHSIVARSAPAVPGPQGQKPLPKPVPIITGNKGNFLFFIL